MGCDSSKDSAQNDEVVTHRSQRSSVSHYSSPHIKYELVNNETEEKEENVRKGSLPPSISPLVKNHRGSVLSKGILSPQSLSGSRHGSVFAWGDTTPQTAPHMGNSLTDPHCMNLSQTESADELEQELDRSRRSSGDGEIKPEKNPDWWQKELPKFGIKSTSIRRAREQAEKLPQAPTRSPSYELTKRVDEWRSTSCRDLPLDGATSSVPSLHLPGPDAGSAPTLQLTNSASFGKHVAITVTPARSHASAGAASANGDPDDDGLELINA